MSDLHIRKTTANKGTNSFAQVSDYQKLKNAYEKFLKQAEKSDMANSLTMKQKQLELLQGLREAALKDNCINDFDIINEEIACISKAINEEKQTNTSPVSYFINTQKNNKNDLISLFSACKNSRGEIDNETRKIVLAFKDLDVSPKTLSKFVGKCRGVDDIIAKETTSSVEKLCKAEIAPDVIFQAIDESIVLNDTEVGKIDFSWVDDMLTYKSMGIGDLDSLKLSKNLNKNYENKNDVFSSLSKLLDVGFDTKTATELIKTCSSIDKTTGLTKISKQSINSLVSMKKNLLTSRTNERDERQNPINKLGEVIFTYEDTVIIMKNDRVVEIIDKSDDSVSSVRKTYDEAASEVENSIVLDFARKYKNKNGEIDKNALRTFSILRNSGVTYEYLLSLTEKCLVTDIEDKTSDTQSNLDINTDKVNTITTLKKSGALSSDLLILMDAIEQNSDGSYSSIDLTNACNLTNFIIEGKDVADLLPFVRNNDKTKNFISDFSQILEQKQGLLPLVKLINCDNEYDSNASEILYNLAENYLGVEDTKIKEHEFVPFAEEVISLSKSIKDDKVDNNATNVCIAMCRNKESRENLIKSLEICKDEYGYPNEVLTDIIWDLCKQHTKFEDIVGIVDICKPINGTLDLERAAVIYDLLENDCSVRDVIAFAQSLGTN